MTLLSFCRTTRRYIPEDSSTLVRKFSFKLDNVLASDLNSGGARFESETSHQLS
jgi:hypothetical protein